MDWLEQRANAGKVLIRPCRTPRHGTETIKVPTEEDARPQERETHAKDPQCVCGQTASHWLKTLSALIRGEFGVCRQIDKCAYRGVCAKTLSSGCIWRIYGCVQQYRPIVGKCAQVKLAISWSVCVCVYGRMCVLMCLSLQPVSSSVLIAGLSLVGRHTNINFISTVIWKCRWGTWGWGQAKDHNPNVSCILCPRL